MNGIAGISQARRPRGDVDLERFAMRVVARVAGRQPVKPGAPDPELLRLIVRQARTGDPVVLNAIFAYLSRQRIAAEEVVDVLLPAAANSLGHAWHDGDLDILEATLAIARLQALLRELGRAWSADHAANSNEARVVLAVPQREQHTLGALVVAQQLRRQGVSVNVQLAVTPPKLAVLLAENDYDAVFISVANRANLEVCRDLVKTAKRSVFRANPVVVGGALVSKQDDLLQASGADVVTNDVAHALDACNLSAYIEAAQ